LNCIASFQSAHIPVVQYQQLALPETDYSEPVGVMLAMFPVLPYYVDSVLTLFESIQEYKISNQSIISGLSISAAHLIN